MPALTLLVSTYNAPELLRLSLLSLQSQTMMPLEVIVADDGSSSHTAELIQSLETGFGCPLKHVWQQDAGFRKTRILNKAVQQARGQYIVQIDGDIIAHPMFVAEHHAAAQAGCFVRGSRALLGEQLTRTLMQEGLKPLGPLSRGLGHKLNALHAPVLTPLVQALGRNDQTIKGVIGCNLAYWKTDFVKVNGYNNQITGWGREDSELAARLLHAGVRKKQLKFSGVCYHLHHGFFSRQQDPRNTRLMNEVIAGRIAYTPDGFAEAMSEA